MMTVVEIPNKVSCTACVQHVFPWADTCRCDQLENPLKSPHVSQILKNNVPFILMRAFKMALLLFCLTLSFQFVSIHVYAQKSTGSSFDPLQYVDQLIGSANGGNVFPGATLPYGLFEGHQSAAMY